MPFQYSEFLFYSGADLVGGCRGCAPPRPPEMTCGFLIQLVFYQKIKIKKTTRFIGVEVEQETSATPPKKILDPPLLLASTDSDKTKSVNKDSPFEGVHKERSDC